MSLRALVCGWMLLGLWAGSAAGQQFPYRAYVNADEVYVRSGPGHDYYPTQKLPGDEVVEVYRHDPGGWYAVRPPAGSYSWVSGRYLRLVEDNIAVVTADGVVARVGSKLTAARDIWQVKLHRDEEVEVLERKRSDSDLWYKIAPPAGEFRWIYGKYLERDERGPPRREPIGQPRGPAPRVDETSGSAIRPAARGGRSPRESVGSLYETVDALDLELSAIVCEHEDAWEFGALRDRAERALEEARTATERSTAQRLVERIARFQSIREERLRLAQSLPNATPERTARRGADRPLGLARVQPRVARPAAPVDARYDGVGYLKPLNSREPGSPQFALLDEEGNVQYLVTAAPDVNLNRYTDQKVGLVGSRDYLTEYKSHHIVAKNVSPLDRPLRR